MAVTSREGLKQYCLRELGYPVLEINASDEQLEDRIDEALEYWRLYHHEGTEKVYPKHRITASRINILEHIADQFAPGTEVVGQTSGAIATIVEERGATQTTTSIICRVSSRSIMPFEDGETITGKNSSGDTLTATVENVVLGDVNNKYVPIPEWIYGISRVLPFAGTQSSKSMFDIQYQLRLNDLYDLTSTSIIYYKQIMSHLSLLDMELNGRPLFRFNRLQNRMSLDISWNTDVAPGSFIVIECYRALNPAEFTKVWSEPWLKKYTAALFKKQWASNLKKFAGLQLPGGVTLNGVEMYKEAIQEIKELEEQLRSEAPPCEFFMG